MPSDWQRLHGFTVVSRSLGLARQLLLPAIIGGASAGDDITTTLQWIAIILALPSIALAFAQWLMFRYRLETDELIIQSGVLNRRRRIIPLARLQNIDLEQSLVERLAKVAQLRLETASGGGKTEASLAVMELEEARSLQTDLLRRRDLARSGAVDATERDEVAAATEPPLLRLSVTDLAIAGATSNEAGLLAAGLATALQLADDLGGLDRVGEWIEAAFARGAALGAVGALAVGAGIAIAVLVLGWVLSVAVSILRYHDFTLTRSGGELRRDYGLLSRHHSTVPLERVQAVRIEETLLRRPLGLVALKIDTAGSGPEQRERGRQADAFVPIARHRDVGPLLREVFPDAHLETVDLNPVSPLARRRVFLRLAIPVALGAAITGTLLGPRWLALLGLLVPAWLYAAAEYRARAWATAGLYAIARGGVLTRVTWVVPERKIQTLHVAETPFQRRLDLATLVVDTAGTRAASVADLERPTARSLLDRLARQAEAARRLAMSGRPT